MTHVQESPVGSLTELLDEGRDMLQAGNSDKAIELFQRATQTHPRNSKAWNDLGVALHSTQKPNLAIEAFKMAILMDAGHIDAALNLSIFHYNRGRAIDGFSVLREAYRRNPTSTEIRDEMLDQGLLQWKPLALIWKGGDLEVVKYAETALKQAGFMVNSPENAVVAACSPLQEVKPASWVRYFRQVQPMLFLIPPGARIDQEVLDAAKRVGVPVHMMSDFLPERGWDSDLDEVENALKVILQEIPKPPKRDNAPDPLITVVVTATRNDSDCSGVLDRLSLQDMEPGLFEVVVVDDGVRPALARTIVPEHFPYPCRMYRSEAEGLFVARDRAVEDARGKWVFYFSQAERPGPRAIRRMLRESLAEKSPTLDIAPGQTSMNQNAPAGKFWQYQLRQAIREEVSQLMDTRLNTVDFGLQMQSLMESANFVRRTIPAEKCVQYTELLETVRAKMLNEGRCIALGRTQSQWLTMLAEGVERKMEGFQAVFSTADVIVEEASTSIKAGDSDSVHWTAGVLSHTLPMASGAQSPLISFMVFDGCRADAMDFTFERVKSSIQTGSVILVREPADAFGHAKAARETFQEVMESMGFQFEYLGIATDDKACVFAVQVTQIV